MRSAPDAREQRLPVLDGLRGIAILFVLLVHFTPDYVLPLRIEEWARKAAQAGWIGVDLFFVLSGFLITNILLRAKKSPNYFRAFYWRRVLRIFPLYYAALAFVFIVLPTLKALDEASFEPIRNAQVFNWIYLTNLGWWLLGKDAFASHQIDLRYFWSLAVEEHFYLFWPAAVMLTSVSGLRRLCVVLFISAFGLRCIGSMLAGDDLSYLCLTPLRWDSLAAGAFVATLAHEYGPARLRALAPVAVIVATVCTLFVAACFFIQAGLWPSSPAVHTVGLSAVATAFACALVLLVPTNSIAAQAIACTPLRFFGKYSYGLYVIHGIMQSLIINRYMPPDAWMEHFTGVPSAGVVLYVAACIALCLPPTLASWHLLEKPMLRLKSRFPYSTSYGDAGAAARQEFAAAVPIDPGRAQQS